MKGVIGIKRLRVGFVFLFVLLISIAFPMNVLAEGSLFIPRWNVESELLSNGDLYVEEDITFDFSGEFNGAFREIVLDKTIQNLQFKIGTKCLMNHLGRFFLSQGLIKLLCSVS